MQKKNWKDLNHLQIGKYAEYLAKMEFILYGFDVFTPELDHKGIDFIVRKDEMTYFDIQVKSSRDLNYIFFLKEKFQLKENLYAVIVIFTGESKSDLYWSSPQKVVHLLVWEINPIRNMKGGLKWLRKDTNPKKS